MFDKNIEELIKNNINNYGVPIIIRHLNEDNLYSDIVLYQFNYYVTQLVSPKKYQQLYEYGQESILKRNFIILTKNVPNGFSINKNDLVMTLDKDAYIKYNKYIIIEKFLISQTQHGYIQGNNKYIRLYCENYKFNRD